jgi:hypothetical protein
VYRAVARFFYKAVVLFVVIVPLIPTALQTERAHRLAHREDRRDALVTGYIMPDSSTGV